MQLDLKQYALELAKDLYYAILLAAGNSIPLVLVYSNVNN